MRKNIKKFGRMEVALLILVLLISLFVRFYNFNERITFGPEQAISLITSGDYIKTKFSLLGFEYLKRTTTTGHKLFESPLFGYSLIPLELLFKFNPVPITGYFALLNIATGIALYWVTKKIFGEKIALYTIILFLFNDYMIYHSMFIWILNYLPLVSIFTIYYLFLFKKKGSMLFPLLLGVLSGISVGLEYFYVFTFLLVFLTLIYISKKRIITTILFSLGVIIGEAPVILFDLKHNFYHTKTLIQYLLDTLAYPSQSQITYYHFLNFWPLFAIILALVVNKISKKRQYLAWIFLIIYIGFNLTTNRVDFNKPTGMPPGLIYQDIEKAASAIAQDNPNNFNVAVLLDFDTRGHILRYPLQFLCGVKPLGVENYKEASEIYVLSKNDYDYENPKVWELQVFVPYKKELLISLSPTYVVYKLTKDVK